MPERNDHPTITREPTEIAFWVRRSIVDDEPMVVIRVLFDDRGLVNRERYDRTKGLWVDHHGIEHTGIGGAVDWDTATPEEATEILRGWGYRGNPVSD